MTKHRKFERPLCDSWASC